MESFNGVRIRRKSHFMRRCIKCMDVLRDWSALAGFALYGHVTHPGHAHVMDVLLAIRHLRRAWRLRKHAGKAVHINLTAKV